VIPFLGREAYQAQKTEGKGPYLCSIKLKEPDAYLHHNEPVLRDVAIIGFITSGAFCYGQGAATGLCLISPPEGKDGLNRLSDGDCTVLVEGRSVPATISRKPFLG